MHPGSYIWGAISGVIVMIGIALVAEKEATRVCQLQNWAGEVCQCRLTTHLDEKPTK